MPSPFLEKFGFEIKFGPEPKIWSFWVSSGWYNLSFKFPTISLFPGHMCFVYLFTAHRQNTLNLTK